MAIATPRLPPEMSRSPAAPRLPQPLPACVAIRCSLSAAVVLCGCPAACGSLRRDAVAHVQTLVLSTPPLARRWGTQPPDASGGRLGQRLGGGMGVEAGALWIRPAMRHHSGCAPGAKISSTVITGSGHSLVATMNYTGGGGQRLKKKVCVHEINLQSRAPLINFIFFLRKNLLMCQAEEWRLPFRNGKPPPAQYSRMEPPTLPYTPSSFEWVPVVQQSSRLPCI